MDLESYENRFHSKNVDISLAGVAKSQVRKITHRSSKQWLSWGASWFPAIKWIRHYKFKSYLVKDVLAGLTVGIFNIPQGMAYGMLAGLAPINGLYTSLFLPLVYTFLGTSKHVAVGTFAMSSLMTATALDNQVLDSNVNDSSLNSEASFWCGDKSGKMAYDDLQARVEMGVALALLVGLCQILLGALKLGFLTILLSDQLIQALTCGAAVHIFSSQIRHAFGVNISKVPGPIALIKLYGCLFKHITETNVTALVTCIICIAVLYLTKTFIDPKTKPKIHFPIPIELLIVIVTTIISWQVNFNSKFDVFVVGEIPQGIEAPSVPNIKKYIWRLLPDAFSIAIVAFAIEVSVAKHFAKQFNYAIDSNQEWFALGFAHFVGSFFHCHPGGASMSRSMVMGSQGGKSQIVGLVNCMVILVVLFSLAALFHDLPKCVLSAIIMVALRSMLKQLGNLPGLFKKSKIDFMIWIVTFAAVVLIDVIKGLAIGVGFALLTFIGRSLWPHSFDLEQMDESKKFHESETFAGLQGITNVKIFRFDAPLYYGNVEYFKSHVYQHMGVDPVKQKRRKMKREKKQTNKVAACTTMPKTPSEMPALPEHQVSHDKPSGFVSVDIGINQISAGSEVDAKMHLILDCSAMSYMDLMGSNALAQIYQDYKDGDIVVFYANISAANKATLEECGFFASVPKTNCFLDLADAVKIASCRTPAVVLHM